MPQAPPAVAFGHNDNQVSQPSSSLGHRAQSGHGDGTGQPSLSSPTSHERAHLESRPVVSRTGSSQHSEWNTPTEITAESTPRSRGLCRFYASKKGCRAGAQCPYGHVDVPKAPPSTSPAVTAPANEGAEAVHAPPPTIATTSRFVPQSAANEHLAHRATTRKPTPTLQQTNPREFQIRQVVRRYSPNLQETENGTVLSFKLFPSDPDFPFELQGLECKLTVPKSYPQDGKPAMRITNAEMARGYQINVERGFDSLVVQNPSKTLLSLLNELDKNLEKFLTSEKAQTIKIVANANKSNPSPVKFPELELEPEPEPVEPVLKPMPSYTMQQKTEARAKREADVRQLEARMRHLPSFSKSSNNTCFNIPVQIPKPGRLPSSLQSVKEITLNVPLLYNLEPCTVKFKSLNSDEAQYVEMAFERHARDETSLTLMAHINYLTQNMHLMAADTPRPVSPAPVLPPITQADPAPVADPEVKADVTGQVLDEDRPHVKLIPRPPEWDLPQDESNDDTSSDGDDSDDDDDFSDSNDEDDEVGGASLPVSSVSTSERGIQLSFPNISMTGIELLEISSISLTVKCDRCKATVDIDNVKPNPSSTTTLTRTEPCPNCSTTLTISYRSLPIHAHSSRAGYLDLTYCSPLDMLPSTFVPTCSTCSTALTPTTFTAIVRGDTCTATCRSCHTHQSLSMPDIRFLRITPNDTSALPLRAARKPKENLGITAGEPLPRSGRCKHYAKSHRWFRFSCCKLVYACDKCHDAASTHPNEHANRMLCGYCSREQVYRPEDCGVCGRSLVGKTKGGGFWEGGKGTRDQSKMRRKERRKFKRIGGGGGAGKD